MPHPVTLGFEFIIAPVRKILNDTQKNYAPMLQVDKANLTSKNLQI